MIALDSPNAKGALKAPATSDGWIGGPASWAGRGVSILEDQ